MFNQLATNTDKSPEPPPTHAGALSDSNLPQHMPPDILT